jgi:hypothetical protein
MDKEKGLFQAVDKSVKKRYYRNAINYYRIS